MHQRRAENLVRYAASWIVCSKRPSHISPELKQAMEARRWPVHPPSLVHACIGQLVSGAARAHTFEVRAGISKVAAPA
jgi:hypothetical protein